MKSSVHSKIFDISALAGLAGFVVWLAWPVLTGDGLPFGTDVHGHLARVWYMADQLRETGSIPEWFPHWYNGTAISQYYPPLATLVMLPVQLIVSDITTTYAVFVVFSLLAAAGLAYGLARRWVNSPWAALAAFIYVAAPFNVRTVFNEGNLPRTMELAIIPAVAWMMFLTLDRPTRRNVSLLCAATVALVLTHHQQAGLVLIGLTPIPLSYVGRSTESRFRIGIVFGAFLMGVLLSAWWLLPALTHIDYRTVPDVSLLPERLHLFSMSFGMFDPTGRDVSIEAQYFGLSLVAVGTLGALMLPTRRKAGMLIAGYLSLLLAFGENSPAWSIFPLDGVFPERFLHLPSPLFALLIAELGGSISRYRLHRMLGPAVFVAVLAVVVWDFGFYWSFPRLSDYSTMQATLDELPTPQAGERMDARGWPGGSVAAFLPVLEDDRRLSYGWSIETTPHLPTFSQHNTAIRGDDAEFISRNYELWNVRAAVITRDDQPLIDELQRSGFGPVLEVDGNVGMVSSEPSKPVMELGSNAIAIGHGRYVAATALSWMSYATSPNVDDITDEYLSGFRVIFLFDFEFDDRARLERRIRGWVADGKTVVLDLTRMPDPQLFGVTTSVVTMAPKPVFHADPDVGVYDGPMYDRDFGSVQEPWRGVSYRGLDGSSVMVQDVNGESWPAYGYRKIEEGKVYFLGLNLFTHTLNADDEVSRGFLYAAFSQSGAYVDTVQPTIDLTEYEIPSDEWGFRVNLPEPTRVLASETWSPHWQVRSNGESVPVYNHENLVLLELSAGNQRVEFVYRATWIQWSGWLLTGVFALLAVLLFVRFRSLRPLYENAESIVRSLINRGLEKAWNDDATTVEGDTG